MTKLAPEWVRTSDPVIRSPARYRWTTAPAAWISLTALSRINDSGLLAWIIPTALSWGLILLIMIRHKYNSARYMYSSLDACSVNIYLRTLDMTGHDGMLHEQTADK